MNGYFCVNVFEMIDLFKMGMLCVGVIVLYLVGCLLSDDELVVCCQCLCCVIFIKWLCKVYGWVGLWGVVFGLLFGVIGVLLNYCVLLLKILIGELQVEEMQIVLFDLVLKMFVVMMKWLQQELYFDGKLGCMCKEFVQVVVWGDKCVMQFEYW